MNTPARSISRPSFLLALLVACSAPAVDPPFVVEDREIELNRRQPPVAIMDAVGIRPGMAIGEIGAGRGRMTMWLAQRVGADGRIWANDIDTDALGHLARRAERDGFANISAVVGEVDDPRLPGQLDMLFMINVYHHIENPVALLRNASPSLDGNGTLVIVECDPARAEWGVRHGCTDAETMATELAEAGFELIRSEDLLANDLIFIARPRRQATPQR